MPPAKPSTQPFRRFWVARDFYHDVVRHALERDGWRVTHDPLKLETEGVKVLIDLGAERLIVAEREQKQIAVEVKTFIGSSDINDFHTALGQFLNYRILLFEQQPQRELFLAVPEDTWLKFFQLRFVQKVVEQFSVRILVYNPVRQEVVLWM